jgi:hypothetical protein
MARNKRPTGVVDTKGMPAAKPTGIANAMQITSSLEAGADISKTHGAQTKNPKRGLRAPRLGPHRPR